MESDEQAQDADCLSGHPLPTMCRGKRASRAGAGMGELDPDWTGIGHGTEAGRRGWRYRSRPQPAALFRRLTSGRLFGDQRPYSYVSRAAMLSRRAAGRIMQWTVTGGGGYLRDVRCDGSLWLARGLG